ncbi:MAG TPA: type II toxin-antitoxin system RelB/DinJ family antitoxin [Candidatus Methanoperedens sp.]|nr:type II toxin-antitoxin system RelB/DinJ family antitoxin [Candidatus Methanoperedens sp.]
MAKTATIHARTEPELKTKAEAILKELGMNYTEAINLFLRQVTLRKGLPFDVKIPNRVTRETFEKTDRGEDLKSYDSIDDMFKDLDI